MDIQQRLELLEKIYDDIYQDIALLRIRLQKVEDLMFELSGTHAISKENSLYGKAALRTFNDEIVSALKKATSIDNDNKRMTKRDLASALSMNYQDFIQRLSGTAKSHFRCDQISQIIVELIIWGGITSRGKANDLSQMMGCPPFSSTELDELGLSEDKSDLIAVQIRSLITQDKASRILELYTQDNLEQFMLNDQESVDLRLRLFDIYINSGYRNKFFFNRLVNSSNTEIKRKIIIAIQKDQASVDDKFLLDILSHSDSTLVSRTVLVIKKLMVAKKTTISLHDLCVLKNHSYWAVRKNAISCIVDVDDDNSIPILYEFRTSTYHVSKQIIRDYLLKRYCEKRLNDIEMSIAISILQDHQKDNSASKTTQSRTNRILDILVNRKDCSEYIEIQDENIT